MNRFSAVTAMFGVSILVIWAIFQTYASAMPKNNNSTIKVQPSHNEIMKVVNSGNGAVIPVPGEEAKKVAPVFGPNGAVVSDPSGTLLNAASREDMAIPVTGADRKVAPVFDANGAVVSDPSGAILNNSSAGSSDMQIAPVFDANGAVVSDPSGTLLNASHP